ncbi:MAG: hypothetical protein EPO32_07630 [Anaerolineae bacterium]|nr:MAG: hypothetical protein EPO32_07630 [Anaerolineae bacterium]
MLRKVLALIALVIAALACALPGAPAATEAPAASAIPPSDTAVPSETPVPTDTPTAPPTETETPTLTLTVTQTFTPTITPTYAVLRGSVIPDKLSCRFGPGAMYLYKYGLVATARMDVIGRIEDGTWVLLLSRGDRPGNACWANASLLDIDGDVMAVAPVDPHIVMPWSPYYPPLTGVSASRAGNTVTVFWHPLILRAGDDSEQIPYILEAWVCVGGQLVFTPVGSYETAASVTDEPGCAEPSHGRVLAAEKHGYTRWVEVAWPAVGAPGTAAATATP